jgi:two-component system OmpR family response regulator
MAKILVVEDDPTMGGLVSHGLEEVGYDVTLVTNGVDALVAIANDDFSAAAIDVMLPEMNGFEICRHIRNQGNSLPVLLLTARDAVEDRVLGLDSGADDYLIKPFAFAELTARIRALVRRDSAAPRSTLRVGTVTLDAATIRATVGDTAIALSAKEFALLWMLAARAGEPSSRNDILQEVWGTTQYVDPTIVDQYIRYLRRKLEPLDTGFTIATLRGVGYVLTVDA